MTPCSVWTVFLVFLDSLAVQTHSRSLSTKHCSFQLFLKHHFLLLLSFLSLNTDLRRDLGSEHTQPPSGSVPSLQQLHVGLDHVTAFLPHIKNRAHSVPCNQWYLVRPIMTDELSGWNTSQPNARSPET